MRSADCSVVVSIDFSVFLPVLVVDSLNIEEDDLVGTEELFSADALESCVSISSLLLVVVVLTIEFVACFEVGCS